MKRRSMVGAALAVVASLALAGSAMAAGFTNGSFENTSNTYVDGGGGFMAAVTGTTIPGWTVTTGNVDWINTYWQAEDGSFSLDLDGTQPGAISQTFATMPNATYFVQFYLSGNPDPNSYCQYAADPTTCPSPSDKTLTVTANGSQPGYYSFDTSFYGNGHSSMDWQVEGYSFIATSSGTTLTFTSTTPGGFGPALDNVTVTQEATATGAQCKDGGWKTMYDGSGAPFKNQGACVSYYATSGATPIGPAAPAAYQTAPLYDVTTTPGAWDCALGATNTTGGTHGTVTWTTTGSSVMVTISVVGGLPSSTYDAWVEQNPGTCPPGTSSPSNPGAVVTDASGNGSATFFFTPVAGATNFWVSLWSPAGSLTGTSVLRSTAVVL